MCVASVVDLIQDEPYNLKVARAGRTRPDVKLLSGVAPTMAFGGNIAGTFDVTDCMKLFRVR